MTNEREHSQVCLNFAESVGANYIVSGDADLTDLAMYNQTSIIKIVDFKAMMNY